MSLGGDDDRNLDRITAGGGVNEAVIDDGEAADDDDEDVDEDEDDDDEDEEVVDPVDNDADEEVAEANDVVSGLW